MASGYGVLDVHSKILIVDPIATNRIVLKVKLTTAFYDVIQARTVVDALAQIELVLPDVIITAARLPDGDANALVKIIRGLPGGGEVPILAIDPTNDTALRQDMLQNGVDDVLECPNEDTFLMARIRSLMRSYSSVTEWQMRDDTSRALGVGTPEWNAGSAVLITDNAVKGVRWLAHLRPIVGCDISIADTQKAFSPFAHMSSDAVPDAFVLVFDDKNTSRMLRVLTSIRAHSHTRHCAVLALFTSPNPAIATQVLDLGTDDLMSQGFHPSELSIRLQKLIRRKHMATQLRTTMRTGLEAAICDPLTGLYNRRYAMPRLDLIASNAVRSGEPFAVLVADMDHFKTINDRYGHSVGDTVLKETARRLGGCLRNGDLVARIGGEEFLIVLPGVDLHGARIVAQQLRKVISDHPFDIPEKDLALTATVSLGLAIGGRGKMAHDCAQSTSEDIEGSAARALLEYADQALFRAKTNGRNQVTLSRPAA